MEHTCSDYKLEHTQIINVEEKLNSELLSYFRGEKDGYVQVGAKKWLLPLKYKKLADEYSNFQVRSDDIWIAGIPRSGTTVTSELVWLLTHDLDFKAVSKLPIAGARFFEANIVINEKLKQECNKEITDHSNFLAYAQKAEDTLKVLREDEKRRIIQTHLPFELLPKDIFDKGCKVIYICRYPKDVAVSYFFFQKQFLNIKYVGDFPKFWNFFQNGSCIYGPYFEHVKQGFEKKDMDNFLFVFYGDLIKDLKGFIKKISEFLERPLSEDEFRRLENHLDFENFKKSKAKLHGSSKVNIIKKGRVGGWKEYFTEEMSREADEWIEKHTKEIGIRYPESD